VKRLSVFFRRRGDKTDQASFVEEWWRWQWASDK